MAHRKYYNSNGIEVPSVTEIVKMLHKPELDSWANWMGLVRRINVNDYLVQKAEYGSYCHDLFENFFMGFLTKKFCDHKFVTEKEFLLILQKFEYIKSKFDQLGIEVINMELGLDGEVQACADQQENQNIVSQIAIDGLYNGEQRCS